MMDNYNSLQEKTTDDGAEVSESCGQTHEGSLFVPANKEFYKNIKKKTLKENEPKLDITKLKPLAANDLNVNALAQCFSKLTIHDNDRIVKKVVESLSDKVNLLDLNLKDQAPNSTELVLTKDILASQDISKFDIHAKGNSSSGKGYSSSAHSIPKTNNDLSITFTSKINKDGDKPLTPNEFPLEEVGAGDCNLDISLKKIVANTDFKKPSSNLEIVALKKKPAKFYGVSLPSSIFSANGEPLVYEEKNDALKAIKAHKGARFREFTNKKDAVQFASQPADLIGESPVPMRNGSPTTGSPENSSSFRQPTSQQTVQVRKAIEKGDFDKFLSSVWSNPMYLINNADAPTIMQEGTRYNAMHVAAKSNQPKMCQEILNTVENPSFFKKLYPDDTVTIRANRIYHITDLYLNSVDKALLETPLHLAAKFGFVQVVKILLSHPLCDKNKTNKFGSSARELICSRCSSNCPDLVRKIKEAFEGELYIPVLRDETNAVQPIIGKPCPLERVKNAITPIVQKSDIHDPIFSVKAYAGPMSPTAAKTFYHLWKHPSSPVSLSYSPEIHKKGDDIRFTDLDKGLERVGRKLAADLEIEWEEYWPTLDAWIDLTSAKGLDMLESYLKKSLNAKNDVISANASDKKNDNYTTPPGSPVLSEDEDHLSSQNNESFFTPPSSPSHSDTEEALEYENAKSVQLSKDDIHMFRAIEHLDMNRVLYPCMYEWRQLIQKKLQSDRQQQNRTSTCSPISSLAQGDSKWKNLRRPLF